MSDRGPYIQTFSGGRAYLFDPQPDDIRLLDIAHALSNVCRFAGHTRHHYSVAQHSVMVSELCNPESALVGLLHDAAEAYIGDMVSPLKRVMPAFHELEAKWCAAIDEAFGLRGRLVSLPIDVKTADMRALSAEAHAVLVGGPHRWGPEDISPNLRASTVELKMRFIEPEEAKRLFLDRHAALWHEGVR